MKFAIFSNGQRITDQAGSYDADIREMVAAEAAGFEEVWISEHTGQSWLPYAVSATEPMIARAAALTERIRFGPAVRRIALYPPQMVAIEAAVCDHLTGGRYNFGFGVGPPLSNYEQWGIAREDAGARTTEALELIRRCWSEPEPFDFHGRFFQGKGIALYPKPRQQPLPIAVATGNEQMLELAGREGFRVLSTWSAHPDAVARIGAALDRACRAHAGATRRRDLIACRIVYVAQSDERARDDVEAYLRRMVDASGINLGPAFAQFSQSGKTGTVLNYDRMLEDGNIIIGSPATVAEGIRRFYSHTGGFGTFMLVAGRDFTTPAKIEDMYQLFAESVVPRIAALDRDLDASPDAAPRSATA